MIGLHNHFIVYTGHILLEKINIMKHSTRAFTLVELIVVITILAILGTIGFISFQGYSEQSRNTVRLSDLNSLTRLLNIRATEWKSVRTFSVWGQEVAWAELWGAPAIVGTNYNAGEIDSIALGVEKGDFADPKSSEIYRLGAYTGLGGQYFQVAGTLESGGSVAIVRWNYTPRTNATVSGTGVSGSDNFVLGDIGDLWKFRLGDYVVSANLPANTRVQKVENDNIFLSESFTGAATDIALASNEVLGLISSVQIDGEGGWSPVVDGSGNVPMDVWLGASSGSGGGWWGGWWGGGWTCSFGSSTFGGGCTFGS